MTRRPLLTAALATAPLLTAALPAPPAIALEGPAGAASAAPAPPPAAPAGQEAPAAAERPIVTGIAFEGDVQEPDRLRELSRVVVGAPYTPLAVRETMSLFYQKRLFETIRVYLRPDGPGRAQVVFRFERQPILSEWRFEGRSLLSAAALTQAAGLSFGQLDRPERPAAIAKAITARYVREACFGAKVSVVVEDAGPGLKRYVIRIEEGTPLTVGKMSFVQTDALTPNATRRALGFGPGDRLTRERLEEGLARLEQALANKGRVNSRVTVYFELDGARVASFETLARTQAKAVDLGVAIEPGPVAVTRVTSTDLPSQRELADAVTIDADRSVSPASLAATAANLKQLYIDRGYPSPTVTHALTQPEPGLYNADFRVVPGGKVEVAGVEFEGNRSIPSDTLRQALQTGPKRFLLFGGVFDPAVWEADRARIEAIYRARGYADVKLGETEERLSPDGKRLTLVTPIEEGAYEPVSRLKFQGVSSLDEPGLLQAIGINPGEPLRPGMETDAVIAAESYYAQAGRPLAKASARYDAPTRTLLVTVAPGPKKRFGVILLRGNVKTADYVVARQYAIVKDAPYSAEAIFRTQQRIYQLGFFDRVTVAPLQTITQDPAEPVDMVITVHERETRELGVGGGYGTWLDWQANLEFSEANTFGLGRPTRLEASYGLLRKAVTASYRDPYLFGTSLVGELAASYSRDTLRRFGLNPAPDRLDLVTETYGPTVGVSKAFSESLSGSLRYGLGWLRYIQYDATDLRQAGGLEARWNSLLSAALTYDTRSDFLEPRYGVRTELAIDCATPFFAPALPYVRPRASWSWFYPFPHRITLAAGLSGGLIQPLSGLPLLPEDVLFFGGGPNDLRGYGFRTLRVATTDGAVTGARAQWVAHLELRTPVWGDFGVVPFVDAGNVYGSLADVRLDNIRLTPGLGLRYATPVGPLRLDVGYPLYPLGSEAAFHLGLGHAF